MFRCELCPSGFVTVAVSSHSSCSLRIANRAICSSKRAANESAIAWRLRSCLTERNRSHRNLLLDMNDASGRSSRSPYRCVTVRSSAALVRTISGVTPSTMRVYFFTQSADEDLHRFSVSTRSNSSMSFLRSRSCRSAGGHISSHTPTMCVPAGRGAAEPDISSARASASSSSSEPSSAANLAARSSSDEGSKARGAGRFGLARAGANGAEEGAAGEGEARGGASPPPAKPCMFASAARRSASRSSSGSSSSPSPPSPSSSAFAAAPSSSAMTTSPSSASASAAARGVGARASRRRPSRPRPEESSSPARIVSATATRRRGGPGAYVGATRRRRRGRPGSGRDPTRRRRGRRGRRGRTSEGAPAPATGGAEASIASRTIPPRETPGDDSARRVRLDAARGPKRSASSSPEARRSRHAPFAPSAPASRPTRTRAASAGGENRRDPRRSQQRIRASTDEIVAVPVAERAERDDARTWMVEQIVYNFGSTSRSTRPSPLQFFNLSRRAPARP